MFVIDRMLPAGALTVTAETAADALAEASAFIAAGEVVKIAGPDGEDLTIEDLEQLAAAEASDS